MTELALFFLALVGCTITVTPIAKRKAVHHSPHRKNKSHEATMRHHKPGFVLVDGRWLSQYKAMEERNHYTVEDDEDIKELPDGRFLVPEHSYAHYQDLLTARPPE